VKQGETLFGIALEYGLDYRELAQLNDIASPYTIKAGQTLALLEPSSKSIVATPLAPPQFQQGPAVNTLLKTEPKAVKLPYSNEALARFDAQDKKASFAPEAPVAAQAAASVGKPAQGQADSEAEDISWGWPATGKVLAGFSEEGKSKGLDISGALGQPIYATAGGKVIFVGSQLRGYGKLIIIKHNDVYLSAYAHNSQILLKEGQRVIKGQKIAEMGNTDADQVKLHFEIRRFGKPVDPLKYLPGMGSG
jgi:lipoprotein NlpD